MTGPMINREHVSLKWADYAAGVKGRPRESDDQADPLPTSSERAVNAQSRHRTAPQPKVAAMTSPVARRDTGLNWDPGEALKAIQEFTEAYASDYPIEPARTFFRTIASKMVERGWGIFPASPQRGKLWYGEWLNRNRHKVHERIRAGETGDCNAILDVLKFVANGYMKDVGRVIEKVYAGYAPQSPVEAYKSLRGFFRRTTTWNLLPYEQNSGMVIQEVGNDWPKYEPTSDASWPTSMSDEWYRKQQKYSQSHAPPEIRCRQGGTP